VLHEASQVGEARRTAVALASTLGLSEAERSDVAIVVTEAANNVVRHGGGGEIVLQSAARNDPAAPLEVLALDRGPGMASLAQCLRDGYSTGGTPGTGLGAIGRLAHYFEAYTHRGKGTALLCRFWARAHRPERPAPAATGGVCLPVGEETRCGDAWALAGDGERTRLLVVDGLGHGPDAATAADEAVRLFLEGHARQLGGPAELLDVLHRGMRATRGAAAAIVELLPGQRAARASGVGNISASIHAEGRSKSLISHNGIVGHQARKIDALPYAWPAGALLVMHSDGLQTRWRLEDYPGLQQRDPTLVAAVLYRDFSRGRDDVTVLVHRDVAGGTGPAGSA
jgi:anti-sigma regulatory factor (Ser/Thr protein kinase)